MRGRQILLDALRRKPTERTPWVPFVGVHGGSLIGKSAGEYLLSADNIVAGLLEANRRYRPDGLPVVFDLQIEAEVLGCDLMWSDDYPPSVRSHPLSLDGGKRIADLPEFSIDRGRVPIYLEATRRLSVAIGDDVAIYGLVCGPFTLATHLMGNDVFLEMFDDAAHVQAIVDQAAAVGAQLAEAYVAAGCDVIAVVDPMVSLISPIHFEQFCAEPINRMFATVHAAGALGSMFVCGNATNVLENLATTGCDNFSIDENIDLAYARRVADEHGVSFGGNLQLTVALLLGSPDDVRRHVVNCLDVGAGDGYVLAPGCDLPYHTPPENLEVVWPIVRDDYQRDIARALAAAPLESYPDVALPNYESQRRVVLDVVTLDSRTCPPCQYLVAAARRAAEAIGEDVEVREHKISTRDGLGYMNKLRVGHVPSLCIDGKVLTSFAIPDAKTLERLVRNARDAKQSVAEAVY